MGKKSSILLAIGILYTLNALTNCQFTCNPAADCNATIAGAFVPDPCDCERYYLCLDVGAPSTIPLSCENGYYFDQTNKNCSLEEVPDTCDNLCQRRCDTVCPSDGSTGANVANEQDCSSYYICLPPGPALVKCPVEAPFFNGTTCTADALQCCNFCTPYCDKANTQILDPCDCSAYYICVSTGQPSSTTRFVCDTGTHYDEITGDCIIGQCNSLCSEAQCGSSGYTC